jgi:hypothetical protein
MVIDHVAKGYGVDDTLGLIVEGLKITGVVKVDVSALPEINNEE